MHVDALLEVLEYQNQLTSLTLSPMPVFESCIVETLSSLSTLKSLSLGYIHHEDKQLDLLGRLNNLTELKLTVRSFQFGPVKKETKWAHAMREHARVKSVKCNIPCFRVCSAWARSACVWFSAISRSSSRCAFTRARTCSTTAPSTAADVWVGWRSETLCSYPTTTSTWSATTETCKHSGAG